MAELMPSYRYSPATTRELRLERFDPLKVLVALLLPPLAVFFELGLGKQFWICLALTALLWLPGVFHAFWVIATC